MRTQQDVKPSTSTTSTEDGGGNMPNYFIVKQMRDPDGRGIYNAEFATQIMTLTIENRTRRWKWIGHKLEKKTAI